MAKKGLEAFIYRWLVVVPLSLVALLIVGIGVFGIIDAPKHDDSKPYNLRHMKQPTFGCLSKDTIEGIIKMDAEDDKQGALDTIRQNLGTGECREFQNGEQIYFEDFEWGLSQVRPQGEPSAYWVTTETVGN